MRAVTTAGVHERRVLITGTQSSHGCMRGVPAVQRDPWAVQGMPLFYSCKSVDCAGVLSSRQMENGGSQCLVAIELAY